MPVSKHRLRTFRDALKAAQNALQYQDIDPADIYSRGYYDGMRFAYQILVEDDYKHDI